MKADLLNNHLDIDYM